MSSGGGIGKKKPHQAEDEAWLMTYADMITLILCFFVIMLAMSTPDPQKFNAFTKQMMSGFIENMIETPFEMAYQDIVTIIEEGAIEQEASVEYTTRGLLIVLDTKKFFNEGSATLNPEALPTLKELALTLGGLKMEAYTVVIEGHTDDVPITSDLFASNWELGALRAGAVIRFLETNGVRHDFLKLVSMADNAPEVPNVDEFGEAIPENREQNRRIVIRVERADK